MAKINSRNKGKVGELEFAKLCRDAKFPDVRRGQQYNGLEGDDVVGLCGVHVEVKRVEALNIDKALKQSEEDAGKQEIPIVAHRKNREKWKITMRAEDWFEFYREWSEAVAGER